MNGRRYYRAFWCVGAALLAGGMLQGRRAAAAEPAVIMTRPVLPEPTGMVQEDAFSVRNLWQVLGAEHSYIEGLEKLGRLALTGSEGMTTGEGELRLLQRAKSLVGTRVYASVTNYVNVRESASTAAAVKGKLYGGCVATVLEEAGDWLYVTSGNVTGYVVKQYLLLGEEAEAAISERYHPKLRVTANTLNIRAGAGTEYDVIGSFTQGAEAELLEWGEEWMRIQFSSGDGKKTGYVFARYVTVTGEPEVGETLAEETARITAEKKAAAEAEAKAEAEKKAAAEQAKRDKAKQVADYAKTAVGTAYVWGGTNLKTGVDCSGLCYAAYKAYGYALPRVSRDMAASNALLSVTPNRTYLKAGDLVFYASGGRVDHVAMYIGDGKVVHASDYSTGVIISAYNYRTPHSAKRVIY